MAKTEKRRFGDVGENVAERFLVKRGFSVIQRNYLKPWGEIDIIAKKGGKIYFVEVKTVSSFSAPFLMKMTETSRNVSPETFKSVFSRIYANFRKKYFSGGYSYDILEVSPETLENVSHETNYRPEDNLHSRKLERIKRTILSYLTEKGIGEEGDWQFDAICVYLNEKDKRAWVEWLEDIIL